MWAKMVEFLRKADSDLCAEWWQKNWQGPWTLGDCGYANCTHVMESFHVITRISKQDESFDEYRSCYRSRRDRPACSGHKGLAAATDPLARNEHPRCSGRGKATGRPGPTHLGPGAVEHQQCPVRRQLPGCRSADMRRLQISDKGPSNEDRARRHPDWYSQSGSLPAPRG